MISACGKGKQCTVMLGLMQQIVRLSLTLDAVGHTAAVATLGKDSQWQGALGMFWEMSCLLLSPNMLSHNAGISAVEQRAVW